MKRSLLLVAACAAACSHTGGPQGYWVRKNAGGSAQVWMHLRADHTFEAHLPGESFEGEYTEDGNVIIMRAHFEGRCTLERHVLRCGNNDAFERAKNRPGEATP